MSLSSKQKNAVENVLKVSLRNKFRDYKPEPSSMPFHTRLLGKDRLALYSFLQSLNTTFGTSIFEPVAVALAKNNFRDAKSHVVAGNVISEEALLVIQKTIDVLTTATEAPSKSREIALIRKVCQQGVMRKVKPIMVDLLLEDREGVLYLFDIKTAKPNIEQFRGFKRTLLEWFQRFLPLTLKLMCTH